MKITQKQMAFYRLYQNFVESPLKFIETWRFVGEIEIKEARTWGLMSYKCPTRLTDIFLENPNLLERVMVKGKSGSNYYAYRIKDIGGVVEESIFTFLDKIINKNND